MTAPLVEVENVTLAYDLSKSWLERKIEKLPRQRMLRQVRAPAADGV